MRRFLVRRVIFSVFSLIGATLAVFALAHAKEDPVNLFIRADGYAISPEQVQAMREKWGLDKPLIIQYFTWLGNVARGDLGRSVATSRKVTDIMAERWGATLQLGVAAFTFGTLTGIPLGILSALRRGTFLDYVARGIALLGQTLPGFWIGMVGILLFAVWLGWLPVFGSGAGTPFSQQWKHFVLPTLVLGWGPMSGYLRITRSAMLEVLDSEFVKFARAKGVADRWVIWKHAFRNALIQPITVATLLLAGFLDGSVLVEVVFAWPGIGRIAVDAANQTDFTLLTGITFLFTVLFVVMSLVADLVYVLVDPRIRYS